MTLLLTFGVWVGPSVPNTLAAANAPCNTGELDNSFIARDATPFGADVAETSAFIGKYNYLLCAGPQIPYQSASSAWSAVEGPYGTAGNALDANAIVQDGYIKCGTDQTLGCLNFSSSQLGRLVYFYAWGNADDVYHMPWPHYLGEVGSASTHSFDVTYSVTTWYFFIDGINRMTIAGTSTHWSHVKAQVANEVFNSGDQLGGVPGTPQLFTSALYEDTKLVFHNLSGSPYKSGHCYPEKAWAFGSGGYNWETWTTTATHSAC